MNKFLNGLKNDTNFGYTENGAIKHNSTLNKVLDMFALGGSYRNRTDREVEQLFGDAFRENPNLAMKCLFYLRDVRGGQGERRFFRVAYKWLIKNYEGTALENLNLIPEFGRWDDLIDVCFGSVLAKDMLEIVRKQLYLDMDCKTPSLLGKWMPSENASNADTKNKARWFRINLRMTPREYRKMLSSLRAKINVLELLMSQNRWDEIKFDKIPSKAGMKYRNVFARKEVTAARYRAFMENKNTKVNAAVLNPVDITDKVLRQSRYNGWGRNYRCSFGGSDVERAALCKYWDNLKDYYNGREENAIAVVDVSGSMTGTPMAAAVGMGAYVAEKSHGPFANHFITFSDHPQLIEFEGDDIVDKICRTVTADWGGSTNIEAVMDLLLNTAIKNHSSQDDLPKRLYIFSDMEFNYCVTSRTISSLSRRRYGVTENDMNTLFEAIQKKWSNYGYKLPQVIFWNLDARNDNIPAIGEGFNYISGFSMSQMEAIMSGKTAVDMMLEVLNSKRYAKVTA